MLWRVAGIGLGTARLPQGWMYVLSRRRLLRLMRLMRMLFRETLRRLACRSGEGSLFFASFE